MTKNINYYELSIYENIYKRISVQYHKTVTCNISVSESSPCTMELDKDVLDVPIEIEKKVIKNITWKVSTWHTDVDKQHTTAISHNISETQYL